jgi:putative peptidoglycan lipid II flippase
VLLPDLSRRLKAGDESGSKYALSRAGEIALALTIPSAAALIVVPLPLVSVLFERGATTADDTAAIALAVAIYGLGLPAFVLQKILQPVFFAREDTRRPFYYAVVSMLVNAALAIGLAPVIGWIAPAIATSVAAWAMVLLLRGGARHYGDVVQFDDRFRTRIWRVILSSAVMAALLWVAAAALSPFLSMPWWRALALTALVATGIVTYFGFGHLFGAFRLSEYRSALRRRG